MTDRTLPASNGYAKFYSRSHECVICVFEPGHNRGDDLPADDTKLHSVGL